MSKTCLIIQPAGLGDILYCQKIAKKLVIKGYEVYWPIIPHFSYISEYIKHPGIHFCNPPEEPEMTLNLQKALYPGCSIMGSKYKLAGMNGDDWIDYFTFNRNLEKENRLHEREVKSDKYCLISKVFASPPHEETLNIEPETDLPKVYVRTIEDFNPFDWCRIIENASEMHFVDTCFTYFIEKLETKATKLVLYPREPYHKEIITKSIWKKGWKYVNKNI